MKLFPTVENSEICESKWERFVVWQVESSANGLTGRWVLAIVWTIIFFVSGPNRPFLIDVLFVSSWLAVFLGYFANTLLKIISRVSGQVETEN